MRIGQEAKDVVESRALVAKATLKDEFRRNVVQLKYRILRGLATLSEANELHLDYFTAIAQALRDIYVDVYNEDGTILEDNDITEISGAIRLGINEAVKETDISVSSQIESGISRIMSSIEHDLLLAKKELIFKQKKTASRTQENLDNTKSVINKAVDLTFIADSRIGTIIERDYAELLRLIPSETPKAVLVLSGSIIEGLIFDALVVDGKYTFDEACKEYLNDMIGAAVGRRIVTSDKLTDAIRRYRNLIHPGREIKYSMVFSESDANLARHAVDIIIREIRAWHSSRP